MVVILLGPPGVGKGTQAVRLADSVGWEHVSTGDLLRAARRAGTELGRKAQAFMDAGELVPDSLILDLVRDHLKGIAPEAGILFDGFPRTTPQAELLDGVLEAVGRRVDRVVVFEASDEELIRRLSGRRSCPDCGAVFNVHFTPPKQEGTCDRCGAALVQRADDTADTVKNRLKVYAAQTAPLIAWYRRSEATVVSVNAEAEVESVQRDFRQAVGH
ncbi:MAG: adenylate kinase [Gemmatimonadetes bacterium]|nr:adenylate kinase [Gemmatimonadota bacterium]